MADHSAQDLAARFSGELLTPDLPGYDDARKIWNGHVDRRPSLIAKCRGVADVIAAVRYARAVDLPIAVRGGGHAIAGHALCDDGLVIDLSAMRAVRVDRAARTVRAEGGSLDEHLDRESQAFGLATTGGITGRRNDRLGPANRANRPLTPVRGRSWSVTAGPGRSGTL